MTTAQAIFICKSIADKYGSAIVSDPDWVNYLNIAQYEVLNKISDDQQWGTINVDADSNTLDTVRELVYTLTLTPVSGLLSNAALTTAIRTASGDTTCSVLRLLNMSLATNAQPIRFIKYNNINAYIQNVFKAPTTAYPGYAPTGAGYQIYPQIGFPINLTALKTPKFLTNTGESLEFDDYTNNLVLIMTVKLAGVQIRDEEIAFDIRNTGIESTR
jgi:hypothetical protein